MEESCPHGKSEAGEAGPLFTLGARFGIALRGGQFQIGRCPSMLERIGRVGDHHLEKLWEGKRDGPHNAGSVLEKGTEKVAQKVNENSGRMTSMQKTPKL